MILNPSSEKLKRKILVTGASSFIGSRLCQCLAQRGHEVYALVRPNSESIHMVSSLNGVNLVFGCVELISDVFHSIGNVDIVYHLAWAGVGSVGRSDAKVHDCNYKNSISVLRQSIENGCSIFIFGGSQAEYGITQGLITEETSCNPESEYGKAKLKCTQDCAELSSAAGIGYRMARIFSVYGPGDHPWTLVSSLIRALRTSEVMNLSPCTQSWNFLFLDDAVDALICLAEESCENGIFNIASSESRPLKEFVDLITHQFPKSPLPKFGEIKSVAPAALGLTPSVDKLHMQTSWIQKYSFEDGIKMTIEYDQLKRCLK